MVFIQQAKHAIKDRLELQLVISVLAEPDHPELQYLYCRRSHHDNTVAHNIGPGVEAKDDLLFKNLSHGPKLGSMCKFQKLHTNGCDDYNPVRCLLCIPAFAAERLAESDSREVIRQQGAQPTVHG